MSEHYEVYYLPILPMIYFLKEKNIRLSPRAILLYNIMLSRMMLSQKNKHRFSDENGVYIYFNQNEMCDLLNCSQPTIISTLYELLNAGLIERENCIGKSPKYYVKPIWANSTPNKAVKGSDKHQREVSFDIELATKKAEESVPDFDTKKRKKRRKSKSD